MADIEGDERWFHRAMCSPRFGFSADLWSPRDGANRHEADRDRRLGMHICLEHCPVFTQCELHIVPGPRATVAGVVYQERGGKPLLVQPVPVERCRLCPSEELTVPHPGC